MSLRAAVLGLATAAVMAAGNVQGVSRTDADLAQLVDIGGLQLHQGALDLGNSQAMAAVALQQQLDAAAGVQAAQMQQQNLQQIAQQQQQMDLGQQLAGLGSVNAVTGSVNHASAASATQGNGQGLPGYFGRAYPYAAGYPMYVVSAAFDVSFRCAKNSGVVFRAATKRFLRVYNVL